MRISDWSSDVCSSDLLARKREIFRCVDHHHHAVARTIEFHILDSGRADRSDDAGRRAAHLVPALIFGDQIGIVDEIERHAESLGHVAARSLSMNVARPGPYRSEEHTSELQSLMRISYAVFCLQK